MPVQRCESDGKPGFRWGEQGKCYTYTAGDEAGANRAREKAREQGRAILANSSPRERISEGLKDREL